VVTKKHGENIKITQLVLELTYDYVRSHNGNVEMEVLVTTIQDIDKNKVKVSEASFKPYFVVSGKDRNDRQDARGSFLRIYGRSLDGGIKITVQPQYGEYIFNKWTDAFGQELPAADGNRISMGLRDDQIICAQYIPMEDAKTEAAKAVSAIPMAATYTKNRQLKASEITSH